MTEDALVRFTAHWLPRGDLHALMARSCGPALLRAVGHLGAPALTGALVWTLRATAWVVRVLVAHGYMLEPAVRAAPRMPAASSSAGDYGLKRE